MGLIVTLKCNIINNICNNIGVTTALCVHSSGEWTGRNLILDEGLLRGGGCGPVTNATKWRHVFNLPYRRSNIVMCAFYVLN